MKKWIAQFLSRRVPLNDHNAVKIKLAGAEASLRALEAQRATLERELESAKRTAEFSSKVNQDLRHRAEAAEAREQGLKQLHAVQAAELNGLRAAQVALKRGEQRPVKLMLGDGLPLEELREVLAGTAKLPVVKAVAQLVDEAILRGMDQATVPPSSGPTGTVAAYSAENRTFDCGGLAELVNFKILLAEYTTAPRQEEERTAA